MRDGRSRVRFCYICGKHLPTRGEPGSRREVVGEHVIPRTLLGPQPANHSERWSVELDVHRACEANEKQQVDHLNKLLQEMHVKSPEQWADRGHIRRIGLQVGMLANMVTRTGVPTFSGVAPLLDGAWRWIRSLHAALYAQHLPHDTWHLAMPPVPTFSSRPNGPTLQEVETQTWVTRSVMTHALSHDKWDGITGWGRQLQFKCVWWRCADLQGKPDWVCFWTLAFPGLREWSQQVLGPGQERPWHGSYVCGQRPQFSSYLESQDLPPDRVEGDT